MDSIRTNLYVREKVYPILYAAIKDLSSKPRAELIRKSAELGLLVQKLGMTPEINLAGIMVRKNDTNTDGNNNQQTPAGLVTGLNELFGPVSKDQDEK